MSKKQTRKTVSMSRRMYEIVQAKCRAEDEAVSAYVERLIRADLDTAPHRAPATVEAPPEQLPLPGLPPERPRVVVIPPLDPAVEEAKRATMEPPAVRENAAVDDPCRLEKCQRQGLHPSHDDQPTLYNTRAPRSWG